MASAPVRCDWKDTLQQRALCIMTSGECFDLGYHVMWEPVHLRPGRSDNQKQLTTWLPKHHILCKIAKLPSGMTVIEVGDKVCYASAPFSLQKECPTRVTFFGYYTEDIIETQKGCLRQPRLLIYDTHTRDHAFLDHTTGQERPEARYEQLRTNLHRFLPGPNVLVQWVGHFEHAHKIYQKSTGIRHAIECLVCLQPKAGDLVKMLKVNIPEQWYPAEDCFEIVPDKDK